MANGKSVRSPKSKKATLKVRSPEIERTIIQTSQKPVIDPKPAIRSEINTLFENHDIARETLGKNLTPRSAESQAIAQRAQSVFATFKPSRFLPEARLRSNYLKPGEDLLHLQKTVMTRGIDSIKESNSNHSLRLTRSEELEKFVKEKGKKDGRAAGKVNLDDIIAFINLKSQGPHFAAKDSVITICKAETEAARRMAEIMGKNEPVKEDSSNSSGSVATSSQADTASTADQDAAHITPSKMVKENVHLQMQTATSPESELRYSIPNHSDPMKDTHTTPTFELRPGPSDVTSYHDFHSLQMAFENVWMEMFDAQLASLGRQLYEEYVKLKQFSGADDGSDPTISTLDDLRQLMDEIKSFTQQTVQNISPAAQPNGAAGAGASGNGGNGITPGNVAAAAGAAGAAGAILPAVLPLLADPVAGTVAIVGFLLGGIKL